MTIYERLDKILPEISKKQFRESRGTGNEINFHIFDYDPEDEHIVRAHIEFLAKEMPCIKVFDLYAIMLNILREKGYLEKVFPADILKRIFHSLFLKKISTVLILTGVQPSSPTLL